MPDRLSEVLESGEHTLLAFEQGRTEAPLWHPEGFLTFVDLDGSRLLRWDPDGTLSKNRVFCNMASAEPGVPDGIKVDSRGRVFCTGSGGVWVIDPSGNRWA